MLLPTLFVIALLDSTSMVPIAALPFAVILGMKHPYISALSFLAGIFSVYVLAGILMIAGLAAFLEAFEPVIMRWWNQPNTPELIVQAVIGVVLLVAGWRQSTGSAAKDKTTPPQGISVGGAFAIGWSLTIVGIPGAVPYVGAVDQILRADLSMPLTVGAILFYSLAFLTPFIAFLMIRVFLPRHSERIFGATIQLLDRFGTYLMIAALYLLGTVFLVDAIAWFLGYPLLPSAAA